MARDRPFFKMKCKISTQPICSEYIMLLQYDPQKRGIVPSFTYPSLTASKQGHVVGIILLFVGHTVDHH